MNQGDRHIRLAGSLYLLLFAAGSGAVAAGQAGGEGWRDRLHHRWEERHSYVEGRYAAGKDKPHERTRALGVEVGLHTPFGLILGGVGQEEGRDKLYRFPRLLASPTPYTEYPRQDTDALSWLAGYGIDTDLAPPEYPLKNLRRQWQLKLGLVARGRDLEDEKYGVPGTTREKLRLQAGSVLVRAKAGVLAGWALDTRVVRFTKEVGLNFQVADPAPYRYHQNTWAEGDRLHTTLTVPVTDAMDLHLGYERRRLTRVNLKFTDASTTSAGSATYAAAFPYPDITSAGDEHRFLLGATRLFEWGTLRLDLGTGGGDMHGFVHPVEVDRRLLLRAGARLFGSKPGRDHRLGLSLESGGGRGDPFSMRASGSAYGGGILARGHESLDRLQGRLTWKSRWWEAGVEALRQRYRTRLDSAPLPVLQAGKRTWAEDSWRVHLRGHVTERLVLGVSAWFGEGRSHQLLLLGRGAERKRFELGGLAVTARWKF